MAVTEQRERNAGKAKKKVDQRREEASGAAGWVAERAGEWSLEGVDAGVPIVPIATVGGPDSMPVLVRGRGIPRALQLDEVARLKMFPIALSAPWGIGPAMLPELPLPTKILTAFQDPVEVDHDPSAPATRPTSTRSTRRSGAASRTAWTRSPGAGCSRSSAENGELERSGRI